MPKITTVGQLDHLINMGGGFTDHRVLSSEMRRLLDLYASGTAAMQQGNLGEAIRIYRYIVSTWPNFVAARVNLANCLTLTGKPQEALQELKHAHSVAPRDPDIHLAAGRVYESMGDKPQELQQYQEALQDSPYSVDAMNSLGATYREVGQLQMAEQWLLRALKEIESQDRSWAPMGWKHPERLLVLYNLALTCQDAGDWRRAVECWRECVSLDPTNPQLGQLLRQAEINAQHCTMPETLRPTVLERRLPFEPEMILIPAGQFLMGSDSGMDRYMKDWRHEQPQHTLYLPDYYLARTPVTNAQYAAFVQATGCLQPRHWEGWNPPRGREDHPVVYVSWYDAVAYCNWLTEVTGKPYRLPSEAEWEKGARGNDGRIYPWGNQWDAKRCNSQEGGKEDTTPVGAYPEGASPYGLLDMAGNVWEWTRSAYRDYPYDPEDGREDLGAKGFRVLRGGEFGSFKRSVRCAARDRYHTPTSCFRYLGFRVVVSLTSTPSAL